MPSYVPTLRRFSPGQVWLDTGRRPINAHGGGILRHGGTYYWYGEHKSGATYDGGLLDRVDVVGIHLYTSTDLLNWDDQGLVLRAVPNDPKHDLHPSRVLERPKVVHCPLTGKFVMWMHVDDAGYARARAGVAVADSPFGPFEYRGSVKPSGQDSRDQTVFVDDDGQAYRIYASEGNATTRITLLTDDFLQHTDKDVRVFEDQSMEAHAVFKRRGRYYLIASGCSGWDPNPARCAVADSIWGPWTQLGNPCVGAGAETTFRAQSTFVLPVGGTEDGFILMADRWNRKALHTSTYVWLPIDFAGDEPHVRWLDHWDLGVFAEAEEVRK
jgi:hypothetical protein